MLRRLAPALGLHTADLFLFAGRTLPDDLTPSRLTGPWNVGSLLYWHDVYAMPAPAFAQLFRFVTALPDRRAPRTSRGSLDRPRHPGRRPGRCRPARRGASTGAGAGTRVAGAGSEPA